MTNMHNVYSGSLSVPLVILRRRSEACGTHMHELLRNPAQTVVTASGISTHLAV